MKNENLVALWKFLMMVLFIASILLIVFWPILVGSYFVLVATSATENLALIILIGMIQFLNLIVLCRLLDFIELKSSKDSNNNNSIRGNNEMVN